MTWRLNPRIRDRVTRYPRFRLNREILPGNGIIVDCIFTVRVRPDLVQFVAKPPKKGVAMSIWAKMLDTIWYVWGEYDII